MSVEDILSLGERKIVRWGQGYVVFLTREAKKFEWNDKTSVQVAAVVDDKGEAIIIRQAKARPKTK